MQKVSVIVPVYNVDKYLARCLDSLIAQTLEDIEIICVNDGSTDNSEKILAKYAQKDKRIIVINQINSGLSEARNVGVRVAKGEFIGYVDSDDFVERDYYEKLFDAVKRNNADIACTCVIRENKKKKKRLIEYKKETVVDTIKEKFELARIPEHCYVWNKIYNRKKLENSGIEFVRGLAYEDTVYTPEVFEFMGKMVIVPNTWYHYWKNSDSIIKSPSDKNRADKILGRKCLIEKCRKYNIKIRKKDEVLFTEEYYLFGIKVLKKYVFSATKEYFLFGALPFLKINQGA